MKTFNLIKANKINKINITNTMTAAILLAFSSLAVSAIESDYDTITGWQTSLAAAFSNLDTSGNGLLLPLEASKGKAFNKKTFAAADADHDGSIDQAEYIQYKTSTGEKNIPSSNSLVESNDSYSSNTNLQMRAEAAPDEPVIKQDTAEMSTDNAEPASRPVGGVIDDSIITTKAKAAIFNTPDLKTLQISVQTRKGEVVLSGFVDNIAAKVKAGEVVRSVGGVTSVTNNLEIKT